MCDIYSRQSRCIEYCITSGSIYRYKLIKVLQMLTVFTLSVFSSGLQSRAALSLLGYCYYHIQDFSASAECYEQLTQLHPEVEDYKVYYAQSLYKAGAYPEATKASFALDNTSSHTKVRLHLFTYRTRLLTF